jgi:hypothetical protein
MQQLALPVARRLAVYSESYRYTGNTVQQINNPFCVLSDIPIMIRRFVWLWNSISSAAEFFRVCYNKLEIHPRDNGYEGQILVALHVA